MHNRPTKKQILESIKNAIIVVDTEGLIFFANKKALQRFSYTRKEIIGSYITDVLPLTGPSVIKMLKNRQPVEIDFIVDKDENLMCHISPILKGGGEWQGVLLTFSEKELREISQPNLESYQNLKEKLKAVMNASDDGIWIINSQGNIIDINHRAEIINDIRQHDVIGRSTYDLVKAGLFNRIINISTLKTQKNLKHLKFIEKNDTYVLVTLWPAYDSEGNISLVIVTERPLDMSPRQQRGDGKDGDAVKNQDHATLIGRNHADDLLRQGIIARSTLMKELLHTALRLARLNISNILILGDSGTGKGVMANFIHNKSDRRKKKIIQINCAALPENLLEAELFGYEKGAFTGARAEGKVGHFELADQSTLFLDEVGDLSLPLQAKLLKYLDDHEILRLGGTIPKKVDCTIIAATNRDLQQLMEERKFREDLYYRLSAFKLEIPSLYERPEDIYALSNYFLDKYNRKYGFNRILSSDAFEVLQSYSFPGNVRELKNFIQEAVFMSRQDDLCEFIKIHFEDKLDRSLLLSLNNENSLDFYGRIDDMERKTLLQAARCCQTTREMAKHLRVSQATIVRKLKKFNIKMNHN